MFGFQNLLTKLDNEQQHVYSDVAAGEELLQKEHAPQFLHATVSDLQNRYDTTCDLAKVKYNTLRVGVYILFDGLQYDYQW